MNALPRSSWLLSVEEYLAFEEQSEIRHEYVGGEIHAMVGSSERHQLIAFNLASALRQTAREHGCRIILNDVKLQVAPDVIYYPDIMVVCDPEDDHPYIKTRPGLVVEILSPSTAAIDRREKMMFYRQLDSLRTYLIVHQAERRVERYWRESPGSPWQLEMIVEGGVTIPRLEVEVSLDEIYEGIELDDAE